MRSRRRFASFCYLILTRMNEDVRRIVSRILKDIQVEMSDEFDKNFERQAFFSEAWARRKSPTRPGGTILVDTGGLRRSITSRSTEKSIIFYTTHPAAEIHNEGGEIVVTRKMKRYSGTGTMRPPGRSGGKRAAK